MLLLVILPDSLRPYTEEDNSAFKRFIDMDCRGCSPSSYKPLSNFICSNVESDNKFTEVDLSEGNEWVDYDEKSSQTVGIYEFKYQFNAYSKK